MHRANLDEGDHEDDETDGDERRRPPVRSDPLAYRQNELGVEDQVLEADQRAFGIDRTTLGEDVTVALGADARRARLQDQTLDARVRLHHFWYVERVHALKVRFFYLNKNYEKCYNNFSC